MLYKDKKDVKTSVKIRKTDNNINFIFTADCGKHGTDEMLDEYDFTPEQLLDILQASEELSNCNLADVRERYKKRYRIKEYSHFGRMAYVVQRRSIFGFWYNPDSIDAYTTGWYSSLDEAKEMLARKLTPTKTKIVWGANAL